VRLSAKSSLVDVAVAVGDALRRAGIRAVLTGGACASFYTAGTYQSVDVDFVLSGPPTADVVDRVLLDLGFTRERDRYIHPLVPFFVEFPTGPLGIGEDFGIRPVWLSRPPARTLALSPTDACRDRLAAFYHWNDRQSLSVAVTIAMRNRIHLRRIRDWSRSEGHLGGYSVFLSELGRGRRAARLRKLARQSRRR
jgi:hypothetical protein